jgi:hypothetical protein
MDDEHGHTADSRPPTIEDLVKICALDRQFLEMKIARS